MRISDWSSDVCSSYLVAHDGLLGALLGGLDVGHNEFLDGPGMPGLSLGRGNEREIMGNPATCVNNRPAGGLSSDERRGGRGRVSMCRARWSPYHTTKKTNRNMSI